jgi:AraC-like DNA-binding protein
MRTEGVVFLYGISLDKKNIDLMLKDFNTLTDIRIAFCSHDFKEFSAQPANICGFCSILRQDIRADLKCKECDKYAFETASKTKALYLYECHAGLTEGVAPVIIEDRLLGYLMMGQTLKGKPDEKLWEQIYKSCRNYDVDFKSLKESFFKLTHIDWEKIYAAARIMDISARFIHFSKYAKIQEPKLLDKIHNFLLDNLDKDVTINDLSSKLNLSKSYLSHYIQSGYNTTFTKYLQRIRIEKAKSLLEETGMDISYIAEAVGYTDPNYFARLFKKYTGCNASTYRTNCKNKA